MPLKITYTYSSLVRAINVEGIISAILTQAKLEFNSSISSLAAGEELREQMVMAGRPMMISVGEVIEDGAYFLMVKPAIFIWYNNQPSKRGRLSI